MSETPPSETGEKPSVLTAVANAIAGIPPVVKSILAALAVLVVGGAAGWIGRGVLAGPSDVPTMRMYQDWHLLCPDSKNKLFPDSKDTSNSCELSEDVVNANERLVRLVLFRDKDKSLVMAVTVPLQVFLEPGMGLKIGDDQVRVYQYKTCTEDGCVTIVPVDDQLLTSLGNAKDASVVVASPQDGKAVGLALAMKGYAEAYKAFRDDEASRKSWWRRLWL
jgi:invasion protein IalB